MNSKIEDNCVKVNKEINIIDDYKEVKTSSLIPNNNILNPEEE